MQDLIQREKEPLAYSLSINPTSFFEIHWEVFFILLKKIRLHMKTPSIYLLD